jgi:soluble lytic murein transglycosylase
MRKIILIILLVVLIALLLIRSDWFWNALSPIFYKDILYKYAGVYKMDPLFIAAIINVESKFNPVATSHKGAIGLMQILPSTAEEIAKELHMDYLNIDELYEPEKNIKIGFYYISKLQKKFNGDLILALAAYNAGLSNAEKWQEFKETKTFVKKVMRTYKRFQYVQKIKRWLI